MAGKAEHPRENSEEKYGAAERDLVALGIACAAIIMFVGTGGAVFPDVIRSALYGSASPDSLLASVLLLNIALIIFGWRRYRQLCEEIRIRQEAEAQARMLANLDPLTGCLNRRAMSAATDDLRNKATAEGKALANVMVDLDNFKFINDMQGHSSGDMVLVEFARRMTEALPSDTAIARLGGDEFSFAVVYEPTAPEWVENLVIRLYETMAKPLQAEFSSVELTMSIGIASSHDYDGREATDCSVDTLIHRADMAMYQAKKQGKNRFFWFEPSMENELRFRNELEVGIRRGLAHGEFVPYYEQQVDVASGQLIGFEMLARWNSPTLGLVSPEVFIPVAEEIGCITELSDQLIHTAMREARDWADEISLSINISPIQLRDPWFAQKLLKQLVEANFPPQRLEIEITESCLHENIGMVSSMLTSLRNQGIRVTLDDFGTGYASLDVLRTLPFDRLKIDRSFISELSTSPDGQSRLVDAIVSLGRGLELPVTCEGIEDEYILKSLQGMGDLKGQGYLYGRPEPAEVVRERLAKLGLLLPQLQAVASIDREAADTQANGSKTTASRDAHAFLRRAGQ